MRTVDRVHLHRKRFLTKTLLLMISAIETVAGKRRYSSTSYSDNGHHRRLDGVGQQCLCQEALSVKVQFEFEFVGSSANVLKPGKQQGQAEKVTLIKAH